ncbi:hypothetical protein CLV59_103568 [Chitinophaga dinghuensis]|uniref:DUF1579 domain-containing protein n=1 Tax=Chitinophaga dinghuensis TaxID=1539050 RepID=A0A327W2W8_9BACT|nr:hypothetical protein [Chitinophaga dinghuensis]RAJ83599.1 hypothetical protein CLV59_103568 [Chitinophaga dinghuensis]
MKQLSLFFFFLYAGGMLQVQAQQAPPKLPAQLIQYFMGTWEGKGTFANGKPIASTVNCRMSLDSTWLQYEHSDVPPNQYKALSMWGVEKNGDFIAYIFDNFGGHRQFTGSLSQDKLVLTNSQMYQGSKFYQHFVYEKLNDHAFKMAYETSQDSIKWRMGDTLIYHRIMP